MTERERDAALERIAARHRKYDDTRWSEANANADDAAYSVLSYLRRRHVQLPRQLAADNVWDELILDAWCDWDQRIRRRELHGRALAYLSYGDLGRYLGIQTRQGARDHLDRTDALLGEYRRISERTPVPATGDGASDPLSRVIGRSRAARGADKNATRAARRAAQKAPIQGDWIAEHRHALTAVVGDLVGQAARVGLVSNPTDDNDDDGDDLGDYLDWLIEDSQECCVRASTIAKLGLVLGELRVHPAVGELAANHGLRRAMANADKLRAAFGALTDYRQ